MFEWLKRTWVAFEKNFLILFLQDFWVARNFHVPPFDPSTDFKGPSALIPSPIYPLVLGARLIVMEMSVRVVLARYLQKSHDVPMWVVVKQWYL